MKGFFVDEDQLRKLRKISDRLNGGTDRERDEGHKLWLVLTEIETQKIGIEVTQP